MADTVVGNGGVRRSNVIAKVGGESSRDPLVPPGTSSVQRQTNSAQTLLAPGIQGITGGRVGIPTILWLQRAAGNQAVAAWLQSPQRRHGPLVNVVESHRNHAPAGDVPDYKDAQRQNLDSDPNWTSSDGLSSDRTVVQRTDKHTDAELMTLM